MRREFLVERTAAAEAAIVAYEDALSALTASGFTQSYTLDTNQSRQTVTRADIPRLNADLDKLYNRLATLEARLNGGSYIARPAF